MAELYRDDKHVAYTGQRGCHCAVFFIGDYLMADESKFVVVGHHSRLGQAQRLAALLDAHLLIYDGNHGANWNHRR